MKAPLLIACALCAACGAVETNVSSDNAVETNVHRSDDLADAGADADVPCDECGETRIISVGGPGELNTGATTRRINR